MSETLKDIDDIIDMTVEHTGENIEYDCKITLEEDGKTYKAYSVSIAHRDLLFYTDKGTLNYDVNTFGFEHSLLLVGGEDDE